MINQLSARTIITDNEVRRAALATIVTDPNFKLMCVCILSEIGRIENGSLTKGANAFADAIMQYPFKTEEQKQVQDGLKYNLT
jgi:hypothetical protein